MRRKDGRTKVLFVCVGNACRSPMAEAIARVDAPDAIEAFSAGLEPIGSVAGMTKQTLMQNGYWVPGLEPKSVASEVCEQADIVINLSGRAREQAFREQSNVVDWEIEDPFGKDIEVYQRVFEEIRLHVAELARECRRKRAAALDAERRAKARRYHVSPVIANLNGAHDQRNPSGRHRRWGAFATFGVLIGLVSLTFGWVTMLPDAHTKMSTTVTQKEEPLNQEVRESMPSLTGKIASDPGPSDVMDAQLPSEKPLFAEEHERVPDPPLPDPPLEDVKMQAPAARRLPTRTIAKTPSRPVKSVLAPSHATNEPVIAEANVNSGLVAKLQPLTFKSPTATSAQPELQIPPPVVSTSNLPIDSPPVALKEIKSPPPPPKPSAVPASMTAAVTIIADPYPSLRIPDGGISKKQRQATSLQLGHLFSRVQPIYPEAAKQQGIQGTVKLHALIGRQGSVENLEPVDGSPVLAGAAMNAVRQWRYTETLLAGRPVETEEDIAITFRLSNPAIPNN